MKLWVAIAMAVGLLIGPAQADTPAGPRPGLTLQKEKIGEIAWLAGKWEGAGWMIAPTGERVTFRQTEDVQLRLDGTIMVIEGRGYAPSAAGGPESLMFNAFAVVSFNEFVRRYEFRSYAMGFANTFEAVMREDGAFEWRINPPNAPKMRYVITQPQPNVWFEIGERSTDGGATWTQFFEMRLTRTP